MQAAEREDWTLASPFFRHREQYTLRPTTAMRVSFTLAVRIMGEKLIGMLIAEPINIHYFADLKRLTLQLYSRLSGYQDKTSTEHSVHSTSCRLTRTFLSGGLEGGHFIVVSNTCRWPAHRFVCTIDGTWRDLHPGGILIYHQPSLQSRKFVPSSFLPCFSVSFFFAPVASSLSLKMFVTKWTKYIHLDPLTQ